MEGGRARGRPCCVWPADSDRELCECVCKGRPTACSSGSSSDTRKDARACARWRGAAACTCTKTSSHRRRTSARPPRSCPSSPGALGSRPEGPNAAETRTGGGGRR